MKKKLSTFLCIVLCMVFIGCGNQKSNTSATSKSDTTASKTSEDSKN